MPIPLAKSLTHGVEGLETFLVEPAWVKSWTGQFE